MPVYAYKGYDIASGKSRNGKVTADSQKSAKAALRKTEKVIVSDLKEQKSSGGKSSGSLFSKKVPLKEISIMTKQFATLQNAHVPLDECLAALSGQVENAMLQEVMAGLKDKVSEGVSLGDSMSNYPKIFDRLYINMIRAGESSGKLGLVLDRLSDYYENKMETRAKIVGAMMYPLIMTLAASAIVLFLFISVIPKLSKTFTSMKVTIPWYTELLMATSHVVTSYWYILIIVTLSLFFGTKKWLSTKSGRSFFDKHSLRVPLFGSLIMRINVSTFTKTLSTLLSSGVPIIKAMEITRNVIPNQVIAKVVDDAKNAVQDGESLGLVIERSGQFPSLVSHMIKTGEKTGQLEEMLGHVAIAYDAEVDQKVSSLISMIEPIMIIFMGVGGAGVVMAMLLPMFDMMNNIR